MWSAFDRILVTGFSPVSDAVAALQVAVVESIAKIHLANFRICASLTKHLLHPWRVALRAPSLYNKVLTFVYCKL